ncbi:MAG: YihA family ribosome biogenesis GTP-binding protein [Alphaproteobacteria bacterium]|nr:YihA family ribosome biogenesis GTP-binding protein [Alphaproteobacteria bacterium]
MTPTKTSPVSAPAPDEGALEAGRLLFAKECTFVMGVARIDDLPADELPEIAFAGRSNVGKSSLINALTGRKTLARTSNTPGRTQQLNFFNLGGRLTIVDLPGYGYAKAPKGEVDRWNRLIRKYLKGRVGLRRLCVLIDARHGLKVSDRQVMDMLDESAVVYQIVLTKTDKVKAADRAIRREEITAEIRKRAAANPEIMATSAVKGVGIPELRAALTELANRESIG